MSEQIKPPSFEQSELQAPISQPESFNLPNAEVFSPRNEIVFSPYEIEESKKGDSYDYLFSDDDLTASIEGAAIREPEGRGVVSDDSKEYSMDILKRFDNEASLDLKIKDIIHRYNGNQDLATEATMDTIRSNKYLRVELGAYFLTKLGDLKDSLPSRVAKNEFKNSTMSGYNQIPKLRSREYASLLALAHLDGTFDPNKSASEEITYDAEGNIKTGQHRAASESLIFW